MRIFASIIIFAAVIVAIVFGIYHLRKDNSAPNNNNGNNSTSTATSTSKDNLIRVTSLKANDTVKSPLVIRGEARGNWYFEASFPVRLLDESGTELAIAPAQAQGEWMTTEFVPFEVTLTFTPTTPTGTLVLEKDNPSGLPEHADELRIPVRFDMSNVRMRTINLYHYNESKDKDESGNILCSAKGLEIVKRDIPFTNTPIQDALKLFLKEELPGVELRSATLASGTLTLNFSDPQNKTSGGSCRISILRAQIEATSKQFGGVTRVVFAPTGVFEP